MKCAICGREKAEGEPCPGCGSPAAAEPHARELAGAWEAVRAGDTAGAIKAAQKVARERADLFAARLVLAEAYRRRAAAGEAALRHLAEREIDAALGLLPPDRESALAVLETAVQLGRGFRLRVSFEGSSLPHASEMLRLLEGVPGAPPGPPAAGQMRMRRGAVLALAAAAAVGGVFLLRSWLAPFFPGGGGPVTDGSRFVSGGPLSDALCAPPPAPVPAAPFLKGEEYVPAMAKELAGHAGGVNSVCFTPDGKWLLSGGNDAAARLWSLEDESSQALSREGASPIIAVAANPLGNMVAAVDTAGSVFGWPLVEGRPDAPVENRGAAGREAVIAFSPNGLVSAVASGDGRVILGDVAARAPVAVLRAEVGLKSVAFSPDGLRIAYGTARNMFTTLELKTGTLATREVGGVSSTAEVTGLAFSRDGGFLLVSTLDGSVVVWDLAAGAAKFSVKVRRVPMPSLAAAPDGTIFVTGGANGGVYFWEVGTGRARGSVEAHRGAVKSVAFSPDGNTLVTAGEDGKIRLWR